MMKLRTILIALAAILVTINARAAYAPDRLPAGASCVTAECHQNLKEPKHLHGPVNLNQCEPCHIQQGDRHAFTSKETGRDLCFICHDSEAQKEFVHGPFGSDCAACHDPHSGEARYFIKGGAGAEGCNRCHSDVRDGLAFLHGPVAMGECLACHTPHQSDHKGLLVEDRATLCQGCHVDVEESLKAAVSVHEPVGSQCSGCHQPHGGTREFFLPTEGKELCRSCHGEFLEKIQNAKFTHHPMVEGKTCQNCHQPHSSNQEDLLKSNVGELCLSCHNQAVPTKNGTLDNIASQIANSKYLHGPIREENCSACHSAHGSDFPSILDKSFPENFYEPYKEGAYDLCFDCHDKQIVLEAQSTVTGFRNGTENLHSLHVNREKGRSCRACHAEHASNQANHIRSEVPFGRWTMKVEFIKEETGGTCTTGCHVPYKYDRVNPVARDTAAK